MYACEYECSAYCGQKLSDSLELELQVIVGSQFVLGMGLLGSSTRQHLALNSEPSLQQHMLKSFVESICEPWPSWEVILFRPFFVFSASIHELGFF